MSVSSLQQATSSSEVWRLLQAQRVSGSSSGSTQGVGGMMGGQGGPDRAEFSQMAQRMSNLNTLAESDPDKFKSLTSDMATKLKSLADEATDETEKARLSEMAEKFTSASESGDASELAPPPPPPPPSGMSGGQQFAFNTGSQTDAVSLFGDDSDSSDTENSLRDTIKSLMDQFDQSVADAVGKYGESDDDSTTTSSTASTSASWRSQLAALFKDFDQSVASAVS